MNVPITIHSWCSPWKSFENDAEGYASLREDVPTLPKDFSAWGGAAIWVSMDQMKILVERGIDFDLSKDELTSSTGTMITTLQDKLAEKFGDDRVGKAAAMATGCTTQISIPDIGLLLITDVDWMEDACTEDLQRRLDDGWRILAVCPPNAARRPDYILGRK